MASKDPHSPYPETRATLWARSFGTLAIGIAAAFVSYAALKVQAATAETQRLNAERDIKLRQDDAKFKEEQEAARVATYVLPYLTCRDDLQRAAALDLLTDHYRAVFISRIETRCSSLSQQDKEQLVSLKNQSASDARIQTFTRLLRNAREYKAAGFDGPAARVFHEANAALPPSPPWPLDKNATSRAEEAYSAGDFSKSADLFVLGFQGIPGSQ